MAGQANNSGGRVTGEVRVFPRRAPGAGLPGSDLLTLSDYSMEEVRRVLETGRKFKSSPAAYRDAMEGKTAILLFEKPSLRTRISFEVGLRKLGAGAVYMDHGQQRLGERESVVDYGRNLERWVDCIIARVYSQQTIEELAWATRVPVINALSDLYHPCQALADVMTVREKFPTTERPRVAFVGDGNNVCHSLMHACAMTGVSVTAITPKGYEPLPEVAEQARRCGEATGAKVDVTNDVSAVQGAHAVYTDVWLSMGQADAQGKRMKAFAKYRVDAEMMSRAGPEAIFMHCLPAHRGVEVTDEVIDSPRSVVYDQAENRMHAQCGLLIELFGGQARR